MMRLVICVTALPALARATRANVEDFAWPWDQDKKHAKPHNHFRSNMMATHSRTASHDFGSSWDATSSLDDSTGSSNTGDFMDQYITETGAKPMQVDDAKPQPKHVDDIPDMASMFSDDNKPAPKSFDSDSRRPSADSSAFASDMTSMFDHSGFDAPAPAARAAPVADSSDSASGWPWSGHDNKRNDMESHSKNMWDTDASASSSSSSSGSSSNTIADSSSSGSSDFSKMFSSWSSNDASASAGSGVSQPAHAPQQQDNMDISRPVDSPIEGPPQRESSIAGASATDQVVDVRLSSELQQSLLQARLRGVSH